MSELKIDLLIPTRRREQLFRECVDSISRCTLNKDLVTLNFIVDFDDKVTVDYVERIREQFRNLNSEIHWVERNNSIWEFNINEQYYNMVARKVDGDLLFVFADDLEIVSNKWDEDLINEATNFSKKYPDKIFCISVLDNTKPPSHKMPKFPCFPVFTKEAREALGGWILHPKVQTWGADYISYCIFEPIDRLLKMHWKTFLNHKSFHTKQTGIDETHKWIGDVFNQTKMRGGQNGMPMTDTIINLECPAIRNQLKEKIKEYYEKPKE